MAKYKKGDITVDDTIVGTKSAEDWASQGFTMVKEPTIDTSQINADTLAPTTNTDFITTDGSPPPVVSNLNPNVDTSGQMTMTAPEEEAQGMVEQIRGLGTELLGESEYRTEQEDIAGLPALQQTQNELSDQLQILQNEAAAIPLQLEEWSIGRGITTSALKRQEDSRLRTNAIAALGVSSLLQASRGNIATAQNMVDRAVAAKYDPIRERRNNAIANLELLINSPEYSLADKNRANAQLEIERVKQKEEAKAEATETNIKNFAIKMAQLVNDARALTAIQNATSEVEARQIAGRLMEGGWEYVATPAERDRLRNEGYEIYVNEALGRTYAKKANPAIESYANQIRSGAIKLSSVPADLRDAVSVAVGDYVAPASPSNKNIVLKPEDAMNEQLSQVVGEDGFISPDDYLTARNAWIAEGLSATTFDTKFRGYKNPNNPYYITAKQSSDSGRSY